MSATSSRRGIARSAGMREALARLEQAIATDGGVIIHGEPGTGGELFARAIHLAANELRGQSPAHLLATAMQVAQPNGTPFVVFDCAATNTIERRLFGAESDRVGADALEPIDESSALHQALGGTFVLKNLPDLPGRLQARLARILRDREVLVMPASRILRVDLRPIAVIEPVDDDRVHPELRRRLMQTTIMMPPLRERREDLPVLIRHLLVDIAATLGMPDKRASSQAIALLTALPWRGNLHELEGLLRTLVMKVPERIIRQADVLAHVVLDGAPTALTYGGSLKQARARFERDYVAAVLAQHHGRISAAAGTLGIQRTNLYRKLRQLSVRRRG